MSNLENKMKKDKLSDNEKALLESTERQKKIDENVAKMAKNIEAFLKTGADDAGEDTDLTYVAGKGVVPKGTIEQDKKGAKAKGNVSNKFNNLNVGEKIKHTGWVAKEVGKSMTTKAKASLGSIKEGGKNFADTSKVAKVRGALLNKFDNLNVGEKIKHTGWVAKEVGGSIPKIAKASLESAKGAGKSIGTGVKTALESTSKFTTEAYTKSKKWLSFLTNWRKKEDTPKDLVYNKKAWAELEPQLTTFGTEEKALRSVREEYAKAYRDFKEERSWGRWFKEKVLRKEIEIPQNVADLEKAHDKAAASLGITMKSNGMTKAEIYKRVVGTEQAFLKALEIEGLPEKEKGRIRKGLDWYVEQKMWVKLSISISIATAAFTLAAPGVIAAAGGTGLWMGQRGVRAGISMLAGQSVSQISGRCYDWLFKKKSEEKQEELKTELENMFRGAFSGDDLKTAREKHNALEEEKRKYGRNRVITKALAGIVAGGATSIGTGLVAGSILEDVDQSTGGSKNIENVQKPEQSTVNSSNSQTPPENKTGTQTEVKKDVPPVEKKDTVPVDKKDIPPTEKKADVPQEKPKTASPEVVGKGEGIEHSFIRQIEADPELAKKLGWDGKSDLHKFAQGEAHRIALDENKANVRITETDKATYKITGVDDKGKAIVEYGKDNAKYETIEKNSTPVEEQTKKGTVNSKQSAPDDTPKSKQVSPQKKIGTGKTIPPEKSKISPTVDIDKDVKTNDGAKTNVETSSVDTVNNKPDTATINESQNSVDNQSQNNINTQEILSKNPELQKNWPLFENNQYKLNEAQLVQANRVYEDNIKYISAEESNNEKWEYVKKSPVESLVGAETIEGDRVVPVVNKIATETGIKPKGGTVLEPKKETVEEFVARGTQKAVKDGTLDKIKFKK